MTTDKFGLLQETGESEVLGLKIHCPECKRYSDAKECFFEEDRPDIKGKQIQAVGIQCPKCSFRKIAYYTDRKVRTNTENLRRLREQGVNKVIPGKVKEYKRLQTRHKKYFDRLQKKVKSQLGELVTE